MVKKTLQDLNEYCEKNDITSVYELKNTDYPISLNILKIANDIEVHKDFILQEDIYSLTAADDSIIVGVVECLDKKPDSAIDYLEPLYFYEVEVMYRAK